MSTHALKRRAPGARVRARAFTLVETLLSTTFLALIAGTVAWVMVHCSQVSNLVSASATLQSGARLSMDVFTRDAQDSSRVLGSYTSGGTTYTTSTSGASSALVLETPIYTYDASGSPSATYTDHIIYRLVADAGADGPYTLDRTVVPQSGSPRVAQTDAVVARYVQAAAWTCLVTKTWTGDGTAKAFLLDIPASGTASQAVTVNGAGVTQGGGAGQAQYFAAGTGAPNGSLAFATAPANKAVIDGQYAADPASSSGPASITGVVLDLTLGVTGGSLGPASTQTIEVTSAADLMNH